MYVLIHGSFSDGFQMLGPFASHTLAVEWAESNVEFPVSYLVERVVDPNVWKPGSYNPPDQNRGTSS